MERLFSRLVRQRFQLPRCKGSRESTVISAQSRRLNHKGRPKDGRETAEASPCPLWLSFLQRHAQVMPSHLPRLRNTQHAEYGRRDIAQRTARLQSEPLAILCD